MTATVEIENVTRLFGSQRAVDDVSLSLPAGELAVLLGPSGCGKTTLLNILGGFLDASSGSVRIGGTDVTGLPASRRPTTTVFQDYALFPHMTIGQNVAFGLRMRGMGRSERRARADEMLSLVGLQDAAGRRPHELSGGQRQRVALARALAVRPGVLLLDEPLGALDLKLRRAMQDELKAIQREVGTTFVHVTHDQEEAMAIADRIIVMNAGRIEDQGSPARIYLQPASVFAAAFMGEINMIPAVARTGSAETALGTIEIAHQLAPGSEALLCVRPEHLLAAGPELGTGVVTDTAFFGTHQRVHLTVANLDRPLTAHLPQGTDVSPGASVSLSPLPSALFVLSENG
ncbi:MAG: ABC transporter ATP-binding protein [Pseudomonadota bacterium]